MVRACTVRLGRRVIKYHNHLTMYWPCGKGEGGRPRCRGRPGCRGCRGRQRVQRQARVQRVQRVQRPVRAPSLSLPGLALRIACTAQGSQCQSSLVDSVSSGRPEKGLPEDTEKSSWPDKPFFGGGGGGGIYFGPVRGRKYIHQPQIYTKNGAGTQALPGPAPFLVIPGVQGVSCSSL